ncbi:hypothetical protein KEM54_004728, partial [Ascosphaera aggregata]
MPGASDQVPAAKERDSSVEFVREEVTPKARPSVKRDSSEESVTFSHKRKIVRGKWEPPVTPSRTPQKPAARSLRRARSSLIPEKWCSPVTSPLGSLPVRSATPTTKRSTAALEAGPGSPGSRRSPTPKRAKSMVDLSGSADESKDSGDPASWSVILGALLTSKRIQGGDAWERVAGYTEG